MHALLLRLQFLSHYSFRYTVYRFRGGQQRHALSPQYIDSQLYHVDAFNIVGRADMLSLNKERQWSLQRPSLVRPWVVCTDDGELAANVFSSLQKLYRQTGRRHYSYQFSSQLCKTILAYNDKKFCYSFLWYFKYVQPYSVRVLQPYSAANIIVIFIVAKMYCDIFLTA